MRLLLIAIITLIFPPALASANDRPKLSDFYKSDSEYAQATIRNFSQLYWALDRFSFDDDQAIDNYLMIHQCDLYKDYIYNEFEWTGIREFGRQYLKDNKEKLPLRFEFIQDLRLGEYDFEKEGFIVQDKHAIDGIRRFEIQALDYSAGVCGDRGDLEGYPKAIFVELSRPLFFEFLPMDPVAASAYLAEKTKEFKKIKGSKRNRSKVLDMRDVFIVMKVKFFASAGWHSGKAEKGTMAKLLATLESIEVYADLERKNLLYKQDYGRRQKENLANPSLIKDKKSTLGGDPAPPDNARSSDTPAE